MKILPAITCLIFSSPLFGRDFRPDSHFETLPAADASVQECYVFRTTAGLHYTVQFSNDLTLWTDQEEFYGLGNEYVVPMRQFTPPPPPQPGELPALLSAPAVNASIRMERASGPAGGTVVAWASLDHGGPMVVRIAGEMATEWFQIPLYAEQFGDFYFFVWHPSTIVSPPVEDSILGAKDSAMLAVLEASLPTMNSQATTSVAAVRNAPAPAPPDPDSKRFWRILVDAGTDTDTDGIADWSEFEMAANAAAGRPVHTVGDFQNGLAPGGNAFNSDSNGDGIPDGEQLDTDDDGIADAFDIASSDPTASYEIGPLPRYALFEIAGNALQINDLGTVLYSDKTWKGGSITDLPGGPAGASPASGRGINDLDAIIGTEGRNPNDPANPQYLNGKICFWPDPTLPYQYVQVTDQGEDVFAYREHDGFGTQGPAPILSLSGQFIAHGHVWDPEPDYEDEFEWAPALWQIPTASSGANRQAIPPPALPELPFVPFNVISQPLFKGGSAIFATPPVDFTNSTDGQTTKVYLDGKWQESPTFAMALDISSDGTAIGQAHGGIKAPILLNGKWTDIKRYAPCTPSEWADINTDLLDTTPSGWVLGKRNNGTAGGAGGVMLPLVLEGIPPEPNLAKEATGVDAFSIGCDDPGPAVLDRIWIMAPSDVGVTEFTLKAPLNPATPLKLSAPGIRFNGEMEKTLTATENRVTLESWSTQPSGTEIPLKLHFDTCESVSQPIGVKIMKGRTVRVSLYNVTKKTANQPNNTADLAPSAAELEIYLNAVFGPQFNTAFIVSQRETLSLDWDTNGNGSMEASIGNPSPEQQLIFDQRPTPLPAADINVFFLGTAKKIHYDKAWGATNRETNSCWVVGDTLTNPLAPGTGRTLEEILQTVVHEIGHVLVGYGHPDEKAGPAKLPGTNHRERLMHSGSGLGALIVDGVRLPQARGHRLVKGEWDEAEEWLKTRPSGDH